MKAILKSRLFQLSVSLSLAAPAFALDYTWTGNTSSAFNTTTNWTPNGLPGVADNILINSSALNATVLPNGNWSRQGAGTTTVSGTGILTVPNGRFLNFGQFTVSGGQFNHNGEYFLVGNGGVGAFLQSGGAVTTSLSRGFFLSDNNANQLGTSYTLTGTGSLTVNSLATYNPTLATDRRLRSVWLGKAGEALVSASVTGDLVQVNGGTATFNHSVANGAADILLSRNSRLLIQGGLATFNDYTEFRVGFGNSTTDPNFGTVPLGTNDGNITLTGGSLDINGATPLVLGFADNGALNISGGTMTIDSVIQLGRPGSSGLGIVTMSGGQLSAEDILWTSGTFNFTGGEIYLFGDRRAIFDEAWFNEVAGATATYDEAFNQTHLVAVPEQSAALSVLGGLAVLGLRRRRQA